ncbi:kinesin-domain-containing protein [Saitoella complicata NRRL Y-17804]|nr:kinesin-domain-containing protein [Saitoella complicata NRRL Y-17804]ODQ49644.1 kinesin-domain-containing protein [Saitoella complicata NRRL Y-17804]
MGPVSNAGPGAGNIKVAVRVRPFNARELARNEKSIVSISNNQTILTPPSTSKSASYQSRTFTFDAAYNSFVSSTDPEYASQAHIYDSLGRELLNHAFEGYNTCIFAYGQTGSGKSYSMMGYEGEEGIVPRMCQEMFERVKQLEGKEGTECRIEVSYLEIYNERVRDLLNPNPKAKTHLKVREHPTLGPYVEDLSKLAVTSYASVSSLMDAGNKARTVAATQMNETSSRSHAVFCISLTQTEKVGDGVGEKVSRISLVDLAGSERVKSTEATGVRLKEGAEINRSLSTLGRVISALAERDKSVSKGTSTSVIPYRDSVLTWLLKDSLGGNSMTAMIAAISPAACNYDETLSTLRYADSAKRIKNHAVVNEDPNAKMIRELKEELAQLKSNMSSHPSGPSTDETDVPLEEQFVSIRTADGTVRQVSKAEIAEQLHASEKLMKSLQETWEEKLEKTQQIQAERERALEDLGISIEKGGVGLHTPKKNPHLVNLSDDPLLAECLVYQVRPGITRVGNVDADDHAEIRLSGTKILAHHCHFENIDGKVTIYPSPDAVVMVNGLRIEEPKRLKSGYRVILGDFHVFRFNNPEEARAERRIRHLSGMSVSAGQSPLRVGTPLSPGRDSDVFETQSESPFDAPATVAAPGENDWLFARREANLSILGSDLTMEELDDDQLDQMFDDLQRIRTLRRVRPRSRGALPDDDVWSSGSVSYKRDTHSSLGTMMDAMSLDTNITVPTVQNDMEEKLRRMAMEANERLENNGMTERELALAKWVVQKWKTRRDLKLSEVVLRYAVLLKEAQVVAKELGLDVSFQLTVLDDVVVPVSPYEGREASILGLTDDDEDDDLQSAEKPCVAVRVADLQANAVYLWSLGKLESRVRKMQALTGNLDRPEFRQHFRVDGFLDEQKPTYTHVGTAVLPLAVLTSLAEQALTLDVYSPYTSNVVAVLKVRASLDVLDLDSEGITANPRLNVHYLRIDTLHGLSEREASELHLQCSWPFSQHTKPVRKFGDEAVRFEEDFTCGDLEGSTVDKGGDIRLHLFGRITENHIERLLSWDQMRELTTLAGTEHGRRPEGDFMTEERHDVTAAIQILERMATGEYGPVHVICENDLDPGCFMLHLGVQRRIQIRLSHGSGDQEVWSSVLAMSIGHPRLLASKPNHENEADSRVGLRLLKVSGVQATDDPTATVGLASWDIGGHDVAMLEQVTASSDRVLLTLNTTVQLAKVAEPITCSVDISLKIVERDANTAPGFLTRIMYPSQKVCLSAYEHFALTMSPEGAKTARDVWRMNTAEKYVRGEENLDGWLSRGRSLIEDWAKAVAMQKRAAEVAVAAMIHVQDVPVRTTEQSEEVLFNYVALWMRRAQGTVPSGSSSQALASLAEVAPRKLICAVQPIMRTSSVIKTGWLSVLDSQTQQWNKRWWVLRRPYLFQYTTSGEEEECGFIINLNEARVDHAPAAATDPGVENTFAIYTQWNAVMLQAVNRAEYEDWIARI